MVVLTSVARETMKRCHINMRGVVWWRVSLIFPPRRNDLFSLLTADFLDPFPSHEPTYFFTTIFFPPLNFFSLWSVAVSFSVFLKTSTRVYARRLPSYLWLANWRQKIFFSPKKTCADFFGNVKSSTKIQWTLASVAPYSFLFFSNVAEKKNTCLWC